MLATFFVAGVLLRNSSNVLLLTAVNVGYNGGLCTIAAIGIVTLKRSSDTSAKRILKPYFWITFAFYSATSVVGVVLVFTGTPSVLANSFAIDVYCIPWAITVLSRQASCLVGTATPALPAAFSSDFSLTPREIEVVNVLILGSSNAERRRRSVCFVEDGGDPSLKYLPEGRCERTSRTH